MPDVLVLDDREDIGRAVVALRKSLGISASYAMDGQTGLYSLSQEEFQLVILDRLMAGMDGIGCCAKFEPSQIQRVFR